MVTGASTADLAVILVDARKGVLTQTRRHACIVSLLGIRHVVLAVNKMDLVDYSTRRASTRSPRTIASFAEPLGIDDDHLHPGLGAEGRQRDRAQRRTCPGIDGPTLLEHLETVDVSTRRSGASRSASRCSGSTGRTSTSAASPARSRAARSGRATRCVILPSGKRVACRAHRHRRRRPRRGASPAMPVTLTLADEVDVSRGDMICAAERAARGRRPVRGAHRLDGRGADAARPRLRAEDAAARPRRATISSLKYKLNVNTLEHLAGKTLELNEIGVVQPQHRPGRSRSTPTPRTARPGGFILIDRFTNAHGRRGHAPLRACAAPPTSTGRRSTSTSRRAPRLKGQQPCVLWFTGLSGAGKSTIANLVEKRLHALGPPHLPARRRQRPPRAQQGPRLHRRRPGREHPPRRRGGQADGRRRADRAGVVHLAVPRRAAHGARAVRGGRVHRGLRRHAARNLRGARPQGPLRARRGAG